MKRDPVVFVKLALVFLLCGVCFSQFAANASIISEDNVYWYAPNPTGPLQSEFDPSNTWLEEDLPYLLVSVNQTVYDEQQSAQMLPTARPAMDPSPAADVSTLIPSPT